MRGLEGFNAGAEEAILGARGNADPHSNEGECTRKADALHGLIAGILEAGMGDGSIRNDVGQPPAVAIALWGFLHGIIQLAASKANLVGRRGVSIRNLLDQGLVLAMRSVAAPTSA